MEKFNQQLSWVTCSAKILAVLLESKEKGNVVGISSLSLGPAIVVTAVDELIDTKNDKIVLLKDIDILGVKLSQSEILLREIVKVKPLTAKYNDPFHVQLRGHKDTNLGIGTGFL
jgi:hypothetical protein